MDYKITPRAKTDLQNIWTYTTKQWNENQADGYIQRLYDRFEWLTCYPNAGIVRDDIKAGYRSVSQDKHIIFYMVDRDAEHIAIIGILHKSMDYIAHLG